MMMTRVNIKSTSQSNANTICINNYSVIDIDPKYNPVSNIVDTPLLVAICRNNYSVVDIDPKYNPVSNIVDTPLLVAIVVVLHVSIDYIL
jgi:hypothetical protein